MLINGLDSQLKVDLPQKDYVLYILQIIQKYSPNRTINLIERFSETHSLSEQN